MCNGIRRDGDDSEEIRVFTSLKLNFFFLDLHSMRKIISMVCSISNK